MLKARLNVKVSKWVCASLIAAFFSISPYAEKAAEAFTAPSISVDVFGGIGAEAAVATAVDTLGNIYTTGTFSNTVDFDPGSGVSNLTSYGGTDAFVAKFDSNGNLIWVKQLGGTGNDAATDIALDGQGGVISNGYFYGSVAYFNPADTATGTLTNANSFAAVYISKLNSLGEFVWADGMTATGGATPKKIAVETSTGAIYTVGTFSGVIDIDPGAATVNVNGVYNIDFFVQKINSAGVYQWGFGLGTGGDENANGVTTDGTGDIIISGSIAAASTINFNPKGTARNVAMGAGYVFISKYNSSGILSWTKQHYGVLNKLSADSAGNIYSVGQFSGTVDFDPGTETTTLTSTNGIGYILKLDSSGSFVWVKQVGGNVQNIFAGSTSLYVTGFFSGTGDFDPSAGTTSLSSAGGNDIFQLKLDSSGSLSWAKRYGGSGDDRGIAIAMTSNSKLITFGRYNGTTNLGPSPCVINFPSNGGDDLFLIFSDSDGNQFPIGAPTYESLTVTSGFTSGGTVSRFVGTNLYCTTGITVDGNTAVRTVISDTSVSFTTPVGTNGVKDVVLTTPYGVARADASFNYIGRYLITYNKNNANGGTPQALETFTVGSPVTLPVTTTLTKSGHTFGGWSVDTVTATPVTTYSTLAPVTFYAIWNPNVYTVTFNANRAGATGAMANETNTAPAALPLNAFAATDRTFLNWNTQANGGGTRYLNGAQYAYVANATLYAQWGVTLTYSTQNADSGSPSRILDVVDTSTLRLPTGGTLKRAGYNFGGWNDGTTNYAAGATYTPSANTTFNPVWNPKTYTVTFNKNAQKATGAVPANQTWVESTTPLTLSGNTGNLVLAGYNFVGWSTSATAPQTAITIYSTTADALTQTLYAVWTPITYSVTYVLNGGQPPLPTQASLSNKQTFRVAARPTQAGNIFAGWSDGKSIYSADAIYTIETSTVTLTAQWTPLYTLHYILNGSLDTPETDTTIAAGTILQIAAGPTRAGYNFDGWLDHNNILRGANTNFTIVEDSNMTAQWSAIARSITYNTAGANSETPTQTSLVINQKFNLADAPTRTGYTFNGWSDGTDTFGAGASYTVSTSNIALLAQWTADSYTVTYDLGGGNIATLPTRADVNYRTVFNLYNGTDPTKLAHTFSGWSDGTRTYAKNASYTAGAANIVLTAQYTLNGYTRITYALGTGGTGTVPDVVTQLEGTTFAVASGSTISRSGYAFDGWVTGVDTYRPGNLFYVGAAATPITLTARWVVGYAVTYLAGTGSGTVPTDSNTYLTNTTFTLPSAGSLSQSGYTFAGWNDGTNTYQVGSTYTVASAAISLTALWDLIPPPPPPSQQDVVYPVVTAPKKEEVVEVLTRKTPTTTPIVATQVAIATDKSAADKLFAVVSKTAITTKTQSAPRISQIESAGEGKMINAVVAQITSATKAEISLPTTSVVLSDFVVEKFAQQATLVATENGFTVTPVNGYAGVLFVPTAATINGEVVIVLNKVIVNPVPPVAIGFAPVDFNKSSISWAPSTSQVVSYEIAINGKKACETKTTSCPIPALIGPKSKVTITAIGNDQTASTPEVIPYVATSPIPALKVNFATGSAVLSKAQQVEIRSISKVIKDQGFTRLVVNGFTDSRGSQALNAKLSRARALAVAKFMQPLLPAIKVKSSALGTKNPIGSNTDPAGQALNRRTEIATW